MLGFNPLGAEDTAEESKVDLEAGLEAGMVVEINGCWCCGEWREVFGIFWIWLVDMFLHRILHAFGTPGYCERDFAIVVL